MLASPRLERMRAAVIDQIGADQPIFDTVLQDLVDEARNLFAVEACCVHIALADTLLVRAHSGQTPLGTGKRVPAEEILCTQVVAKQSPLVVSDLAADPVYRHHPFHRDYGMRFYAGIPLWTSHGAVIGTLCLADSTPRPFTAQNTASLDTLARAVASRLEWLGQMGETSLGEREAWPRLLNLSLFTVRGAQWLRQNAAIAVVVIDIDGFSRINQGVGYEAGDAVLREEARRLVACVSESALTAHLGADQFALLLRDVHDEAAVRGVVRRVGKELQKAIRVGDESVLPTASFGSARCPAGGADIETLLKQAQVALHAAKQSGRGRHVAYQAAVHGRNLASYELERDLAGARDRGELYLVYQPIVRVSDAGIEAVEALLRWRHPKRGAIPPDVFIPLAEATGLIGRLDRWVLEKVCQQARAWQHHPRLARVAFNVNVSAQTLQEPGYVADVRKILRRTEVAPQRIQLEITEGALLRDAERSLAALTELRAQGIRVGIDDFGKGFSSLSYLRQFPVDSLKVDRSFIGELGSDLRATAIAQMILDLGRVLQLDVVGEGVETDEQRKHLQELGCHRAQGFYFARPLSVAELIDFVSASA